METGLGHTAIQNNLNKMQDINIIKRIGSRKMAIGKCLNDWMVYLLYVAELCPSLSISAIKKAIAKIVEEGRFEKMGSL